MNFLNTPQLACFANDNDAMVPELWANESLAILEENMVMARLIHRDFSMEVANFGDVVNTRRPAEFITKRKTDSDNVTSQDASVTNVAVPLDQHIYVTFTIKDGEASKSFQDLVDLYMSPAAIQIARSVDRVLIGQAPQFVDNSVGRLLEMTSSNAKDFMLAAREKLNDNKAYTAGRNLVLTSASETDMLATELFISAEKRGDSGTALREASLGRILGFDTFMDQNTPFRTVASAERATDGNHTAGAAPGDTGNKAFTSAYTVVVGEYVWITGEGQLHEIKALTGTTSGITLNDPYVNTVSANAVCNIYKSCDVNVTRAAGYAKEIQLDGYASGLAPVVGQVVSFGTTNGGDRHTYTIIEATTVSATEVSVLLDRPLSATVTDGDLAFPGPAGSLNLAFHRNAIALVSRPLALPNTSLGVRSAVGSYNDVAMRVSMQYDISSMGTIVTLDLLCGVKVLDTNLGCLLLG
jgi:hypothetical protein